jgi:isoquinoline 1-oxidoreductase beta subunit
MSKFTRRAFLVTGTLVGGGLAVGVGGLLFAPNRLTFGKPPAQEAVPIITWIRVAPDGLITIIVPHVDMGQGVHTALAMMAAEELEADWDKVRVEQAPASDAYANGYLLRRRLGDALVAPALLRMGDYTAFKLSALSGVQQTGLSMSLRATGYYGMRPAGAAAKEMLIAAAAAQWQVPASECSARASVVHHKKSGRSVPFGALAYAAAALDPPSAPKLKERKDYTLVGTSKPRLDIPAKVDGRAMYGIDVILPNMLYAAIKHAPVYGASLLSVDESAVLARTGVQRVVKLKDAVAVVADSFWRAKSALDSLPHRFSAGSLAGASSRGMFDAFAKALDAKDGKLDLRKGEGAKALPPGAQVVKAEYRVPLLAHATMEPMNCTARVKDGRCDIWAGLQDPLRARNLAARLLGLKPARVTVHPVPLGGGFGRRLPSSYDFLEEGLKIAEAVSPAPVKLIWSREEDIRRDYFRPAVLSRFEGALGKSGLPLVWANAYSSNDGRAAFPPYAIPHQEIRRVQGEFPVRTGIWRSAQRSQQGFFVESFIDELAHEAGQDPYLFRSALLKAKPRHKAVLDLAAEKAGWTMPLPPAMGRGIALVECAGSITAQVAEVAIEATGALKVRKVVAAVDCGHVVNPDSAAAQIEGGILFGLSAALLSEITVDKGRVAQSNFWDYKVARMAHTPVIETHFINSGAALGGLEEAGVPAIAPAIANAIFAATGRRLRSLPLANRGLAPTASRESATPT